MAALTPAFADWLEEHRAELQKAHEARAGWKPLSLNERTFYLHHRRNPTDGADNVGIALAIHAVVDRRALRRALQAVVDRHAMLRVVYRWSGAEPERQERAQAVSLVETDAAGLDDAALEQAVRASHLRAFDLNTGPVFRAHLFSRSDSEHLLLCAASHAVVDGVSMSTILNDLRMAYAAAVAGRAFDPPALRRTYDDFADYQRSAEGMDAFEQDWTWWREALRDAPMHAGIFEPDLTPASGGHSRKLDLADLSEGVHQVARLHGTTPFVVLLTAWTLCLGRLATMRRLIVGVPVAGRSGAAWRGVIGTFMNVLPLAVDLDAAPDPTALIPQLHQLLRQVQAHGACSYPQLVARLAAAGNSVPREFAHVGFGLQRARSSLLGLSHALKDGEVDFGGLRVSSHELPNQETAFDISLELYELGRSFRGFIKARRDRVSSETLGRVGEYFLRVVEEVCAASGGTLPAMPSAGLKLTTTPPPAAVTAPAVEHREFSSPVQQFLAATWIELLGTRPADGHQSFFEAGGHSLLATQLLTRVREKYDLDIPLRDFFDEPTIAGLATRLGDDCTDRDRGIP